MSLKMQKGIGEEYYPWEWIRSRENVVGARNGSFQCMLGDCVLLKAEGSNEEWVGIIMDFQDQEGEDEDMTASFLWFSTHKEIRNKQKKKEFLPNELYITAASDINPLASINGRAKILSPSAFNAEYPSGKILRTSSDYGKVFICRRGCNTRTATYTDEFIWEDVYHGGHDLNLLIDRINSETNATRQKRKGKYFDNHTTERGDNDDDMETNIPKTPSKRRKLQEPALGSKSMRTPQKLNTPTHKRVINKKPLEFTPLGTRILSPIHTTSSPFLIARTRLHVSAVPAALPCREEAFATVYSYLKAAISDGSGSCIYISGTPGTGKTATVREVVAQLNAAVGAEELDDFIFVEVNGMKVTDPHQSYSLLWEALRGDRVSPYHALDLLEREFGNPSPRRVPCVVLMDELDQLVTKSQSVMYNFFNWPGLRHSRLIVLAVANTMDLPERTLSNKVSSRLGLTRITFPGYTYDQLMKIIQSRLEGVPGNIVDPDAVQFASRKVAAVSGDARRALDICRRAVEIAESESLAQNPLLATPSKSGRSKDGTLQGFQTESARVTISTIKQAISEATSSPLQQCLKTLPLASKLFLAAFLARIRRTGVVESILGDVAEETKRLGLMTDNSAIRQYLLMDIVKSNKMTHLPATDEKIKAARTLAMGTAAIELMDAGIVRLEPRKGERMAKIRLNMAEDEVNFALQDDCDFQGLGFSQ